MSLALGAVCATALVSCGGDSEGTIPPEAASVMLAALDDAASASSEQDCEAIEEAASTVADEAAQLPDSEARSAVIEGAENLFALAKDNETCAPTGPTGAQGPKQEPTTTTTVPPPTETTTTQTTTPQEKPPGQPPGPPEQPPGEGGGGLGQGDSGGQPPTGGTGQE